METRKEGKKERRIKRGRWGGREERRKKGKEGEGNPEVI